jgi:hypothetical protein
VRRGFVRGGFGTAQVEALQQPGSTPVTQHQQRLRMVRNWGIQPRPRRVGSGTRRANFPDLQRQVLKSLVPGGRVTPWGESMLADPNWRLHIRDRGLIDFGLASVPGVVDGDRTMHVSGEGRTAMNQTVYRILEVIYEPVRHLGFQDKPSRLACASAYRDFVAADEYRRLRRDAPLRS